MVASPANNKHDNQAKPASYSPLSSSCTTTATATATTSPSNAANKSTESKAYVYKKGTPVPPSIAAQARQVAQSRTKTTVPILRLPDRNGAPSDFALPHIIKLSDLKLGKLLGHGSYSSAYEIKENAAAAQNDKKARLTPKTAQPKKQILKRLSQKVKENPLLFAACAADLIQEGRILHFIGTSQTNIVDIYAWSGPDMIDDYLQGNPDDCGLVLELLTKTLDAQLKSWEVASHSMWYYVYEETTQPEYLRMLAEKCLHILSMAKALEHLHQHRVLHRDLKPANIGFNQEGVLKVFDFDLARVLPQKDDSGDDLFQMTHNVGSPRYMAPEIKLKQKYNCSADVYSFGLLVYQMLTLQVPIPTTVRDWSAHNKYIPKEWSLEVRQVMGQCLQGADHSQERPSMAHVVDALNKCPSIKAPCPPHPLGTGGERIE